ncbi:hypothetical protein [Usitatibacter palustris]|uniref:hypothetical protein n=1 Tax=Usitatibacter palustris TaxID=2732487 RepID=UPI001487E5D3|nr:hypothetical protein [Usitatibacter palustris]
MLIWGTPILVIVAGVFFFGDHLLRSFADAYLGKDASIESRLPRMVEAAREKVGTMVDANTRLDGVRQGSANQMVYEYTILNVPTLRDLNPSADLAAVKERIRARGCEHEYAKFIVRHNVNMLYEYRAVNGERLMEVELTKANCRL